jgi:hypothetical protein
MAPELFVVNLKVAHRAAELTPPTVATQHLTAKLFVQCGIESPASTFRPHGSHSTFWVRFCRNVCFASPGRNLKIRKADCKRISEFSFSRFAPAKKSAQIISKQ